MRFDTSQHMRLSQQMKLAPRMIQSMEILQMPMLALQERIDQELESNIALEQVDPAADGEGAGERDGPGESEAAEARADERLAERELVVGETPSATEDWRRLSELESSYSEAFDSEYSSSRSAAARSDGERDRKMDAMANVAARQAGLAEQLRDQWTFEEVEPDIAAAGERLIGYIDDDGLLSADLATIEEQVRGVPRPGGPALSRELLERALREVQQRLDPPGVGARDRRECMLLQIDRFERAAESEADWSDARRLIEHHYEDLLQNRLPKIAQKSGLSLERIHAAMALMRRLNLSPGRDLVAVEVPPIIPDVYIEHDEAAGGYVARLSDGVLPALRVSPQYEQMARDRALDKPTREFISTNVRNASWLIDSIHQRKATLLRVVNVVLARQREYFDLGPQHLKPLPMIEVADHLGIHVGTVSRAVADKWLSTPRGLVPLRKFFSGGTETQSGEAMSWEAVKATLKEVVDAEDKNNPLSDEALAEALRQRGIEIARRTVVKYRQQLDIPPARRRRTYSS